MDETLLKVDEQVSDWNVVRESNFRMSATWPSIPHEFSLWQRADGGNLNDRVAGIQRPVVACQSLHAKFL
jgi:hypothetical protein